VLVDSIAKGHRRLQGGARRLDYKIVVANEPVGRIVRRRKMPKRKSWLDSPPRVVIKSWGNRLPLVASHDSDCRMFIHAETILPRTAIQEVS